MSHPHIAAHLAQLGLSRETTENLRGLLAGEVERLDHHRPIDEMFRYLSAALGGGEASVLRFRAAWTLMYAAIGWLDALQDGDPIQMPPHIGSLGARYNLVFVSYMLSTSLLGDLSEQIPAQRLARLQHLWVACMLRMADGQQQDLASVTSQRSFDALGSYQQIAQAKTGATYALAFGGLAILLSHDEGLQSALTQAGELYGTLLQYADDFRDDANQPNAALTLPELLPFVRSTDDASPEHISAAFRSYVYTSYRQAAQTVLASYPTLQSPIIELFDRVFDPSGEQGSP